MSKRKVCVIVTARPSYARVKTALQAIEEHSELELQLVLAGSALLNRYGNAAHVIEKDGFKVAEKIYNILEGDTPTSMAKTTGIAIMELATAFHNLKPDIVVTIADRFETIATSIAAVPLEQAVAYFLPIYLAMFNSNFFTKGPSLLTHPDSIHCCKYFFSLPANKGVLTGIIILYLIFFYLQFQI